MFRKANRGMVREANSVIYAAAGMISAMRIVFSKRFTAAMLGLALATACSAQTAPPPAGSDWSRVQQIPIGTLIRVSSQHRPTVCSFATADADTLTCTQTRTFFFVPVTHRLLYQRHEVNLVKLSRLPLSLLAGAAIGAGAGAGIGAGLEHSYSGGDDPNLLAVTFAILGASAGAGIGGATDFLAGPVVYRAPPAGTPATARP